MSVVNDVSRVSGAAAQTGGVASKSISESTQDRFLTLLVSQMKNQDPLNPLDNAQITSQLAQLSTVDGINKLNAAVQTLAASFSESRALQAAGLVGHGILAAGSSLTLDKRVATGGVELSSAADKLVVTVTDLAGTVQQRIDLGPRKEGIVAFEWDGERDGGGVAPDGRYLFKVEAELGGKALPASALTFGTVGSVSLGSLGATLNTNWAGPVALSDVKQIF